MVEEQFSKSVSKKVCDTERKKDGNKQNLESGQHMFLHFYRDQWAHSEEESENETYMATEYLLTWGRGKA